MPIDKEIKKLRSDIKELELYVKMAIWSPHPQSRIATQIALTETMLDQMITRHLMGIDILSQEQSDLVSELHERLQEIKDWLPGLQ